MKIQVSSKELLNQLAIASGAIASNPVLPIAEDFLFDAKKDGTLTITATNLDTSIVSNLKVNVEVIGKIAIQAKILLETLKAMPDQPITISLGQNNNIEIVSSYGKYNLAGDNIEDFPNVPEENDVNTLIFDCGIMSKAIQKTMFASGSDDLRIAMTGVLMDIQLDKIIFVATDAHKLVRYTISRISNNKDKIILPKKVLNLLKLALPENGKLEVSYNTKNAFFKFNESEVVTKLIDAKYPQYEAVIPDENPNELVVNRKEFQSSLKRIGIYANKSTNQISLEFTENSLTLTAKDVEFSNAATEQLSCNYKGEKMSISFNSKILIEALSNMESEEIILYTSNANRPGLINPIVQENNEDLLILVMPTLNV